MNLTEQTEINQESTDIGHFRYKYKLTIEYDGSAFYGWQKQLNQKSVQGTIELAAKKLYSYGSKEYLELMETNKRKSANANASILIASNDTKSNYPIVSIYGSSRTDAGVHALSQVAHLDVRTKRNEMPTSKIISGLNFHLKGYPVSILQVESVENTFHARFDAISRTYMYKILNRQSKCAVNNNIWQIPENLNIGKMRDACNLFKGLHDFTNFRNKDCQAASSIKLIDQFDILEDTPSYYSNLQKNNCGKIFTIIVRSKSFLHNQVRLMVGLIKEIGVGKQTIDDLQLLLHTQERHIQWKKAPSCGLYLISVDY
jgi:tRNA pseudouridine38-40 synthase